MMNVQIFRKYVQKPLELTIFGALIINIVILNAPLAFLTNAQNLIFNDKSDFFLKKPRIEV